MCGIFGWVRPGSREDDRETLERLTAMLAHRGPDGYGSWFGTTAGGGHRIAFGHRRLSIIDIGGGGQPMHARDGALTLITNGEIYNYIELREELRARGHTFHTTSDTEVMLEAYRAWGTDAIARFRGMFAFALWDREKQQLILARDAFGKKPLFLSEDRGRLLFSSEIAPIISFPGFDRALEPDAISLYLLNRYVPGPLTFFAGVRKLASGCFAIWKEGQLKETRYFTPPLASTKPDIANFHEAVSAFGDTFEEAVRVRMRSDAPFGAFLSGGIDSSAVVAMMARNSSQPIRTFSVGFREAAYSELDHARAISERFSTRHEELVIDSDSFMQHWQEAILRRGAPVSEPSDIPILMLSHAARDSVKMVLTGEGSDEFLGGYPKHRAEPWMGTYQAIVPPGLHRRLVEPMAEALPYSMRRLKILAKVAGEADANERMRMWFGDLSQDDVRKLTGRDEPIPLPDELPYSLKDDSPLRRLLFFDQTSWLPDNLLERGDRMMMGGSIEGRMPFMDIELAKLAARMPDKFLIGGKGGKSVLRAAMQPHIPSSILQRKKIGFRVPFGEWIRERKCDLLRDLLQSERSRIGRVLSAERMDRILGQHSRKDQNHERIIWSLANLEIFLRDLSIGLPYGTGMPGQSAELHRERDTWPAEMFHDG